MSARVLLKRLAHAVATLATAPLWLAATLERALGEGEAAFLTGTHLVAWLPGPVGVYLRAAYYARTLEACDPEVHVGFGSLFTHRGAAMGRHASMGAYCVVGHARIGPGAMLGSRVSIPSGKRQHFDEAGTLSAKARYETVAIGSGCWIGEGAIVMADVGEGSVVSAGAVVVHAVPARSLAGGNPAKVLRELGRAA